MSVYYRLVQSSVMQEESLQAFITTKQVEQDISQNYKVLKGHLKIIKDNDLD